MDPAHRRRDSDWMGVGGGASSQLSAPPPGIQIGRGARKDPRVQNCLKRRQVDAELALGALPELDRGGMSRQFFR